MPADIEKLRALLAEFDAEVAEELAKEGERADLWTDIDVPAALVRSLLDELDRVIAERDEAINWSELVDRHGTDQFDDLAEAWLQLETIQRVTNAATSTFAKWANDDLMSRFRRQQLSMFHMAFVEGCIAGVKAAESRAALSDETGI